MEIKKPLNTVEAKKYTIEVVILADNSTKFNMLNEGFNNFELLGILTLAQEDVLQNMGYIKGKFKES